MTRNNLTLDDLDKPQFSPTAEQTAIISAARNARESMLITAYAGCAKSTTLQLICEAIEPRPTLAVMFNVKNKKDAEKKFPSWVTVKTLNGVGHSAWQSAIGKRLTLDDKKLGRLVTEVCKKSGFDASSEDWASIRGLSAAAMRAGLVPSKYQWRGLVPDNDETWQDLAAEQPDMPNESLVRLAREVVVADIAEALAGTISYDDQIYCSAMLGGVFPRYPLVLVDEAQDLSQLNHIQVRRSASDRLIVVGDSKQAIYQFRGADGESINKLRALRPEWIELPLATTFRCPKVLVERQQHHAPGFTAALGNAVGLFHHFHRQNDAGGQVHSFRGDDWHWTWADVERIGKGETAILCRNNAPLLAMAFKLLKQQIGVTMLGRDIGKGLVSLAKKICPNGDTPRVEYAALIERWCAHESDLLRARGKEEQAAGVVDKADCLLAVLEGANAGNARALIFALEQLFARDAGQVTLSTGHRAKGMEWDTVIHLDPWRIPSKFAQAAAGHGDGKPLEQEANLKYVIETRAKHTLILANLEDFQ